MMDIEQRSDTFIAALCSHHAKGQFCRGDSLSVIPQISNHPPIPFAYTRSDPESCHENKKLRDSSMDVPNFSLLRRLPLCGDYSVLLWGCVWRTWPRKYWTVSGR